MTEAETARQTTAPGAKPLAEFARGLAITAILMFGVAGLFSLLLPGSGFISNLKYSLPIGLSIHALSATLCQMRATHLNWRDSIIAIPAGAGIGILIGSLLDGTNPLRLAAEHPDMVFAMLVGALVFGTAISYYFFSREAMAEAAAAKRLDALERARYASRLAEADLRLLQAQIEPHFLFNTLANVLSMVRDQPQKAERMLEDFISYLRASLQRSRSPSVTLDDELELLRAYLDIQAIRMGDRLRYRIDVAENLRNARLPPLLIQPLVENAIKHGIEPQPGGGELAIRARYDGVSLIIEVDDNGVGMQAVGEPGMGLANVRDRLKALYQSGGNLVIRPNAPRGVKAELVIPLSGVAQ